MCAVSKRSEAILAFVVGFLIVTFCVGCGSTSANFASTTPGPQTWSISGTLSPATSGTGASVSVTGASATIGGGSLNRALADLATVGGGLNNAAASRLSPVRSG